jgi:hypothetical protein
MDSFGRQDAEQVEVCRFFVLEEMHLEPGILGTAEDLEAPICLDKAHGARNLLIDRVSGLRNAGQAE